MTEVVILAGCRTPVGAFGGVFRDFAAVDLGVVAAAEAVNRSGIDPAEIDEVIFGCGGQPHDAANIARVIAVKAGFPLEVPAFSVQRNCASGMQAITSGVQAIKAGDAEVVLAGGVENLSQAPYILSGARWGFRLRHNTIFDGVWSGLTDPLSGLVMGETAENIAAKYGIGREEQDRYAIESHNKAFRAIRMGKFKEEIVAVQVPKPHGEPEPVTQDESPQAGLSMQKLSLYPTIYKKNGTVTPGNSCPLNDAAGAIILASAEKATELNLSPLAYVRSYAYSGVDPAYMGIGPAASTPLALKKGGLRLDDVQLIEFNEAFAVQYLAVEQMMGLNREIVNVNGGAIALGHPIGATGLRLTLTLLYEMIKRDLSLGLATLCVGGGQGGSLIIERR
ncbi:MAG: thiolase family protein [Chloroflexi bacterium]|nr:thiolase family protein [Chloroflexota bacterium]